MKKLTDIFNNINEDFKLGNNVIKGEEFPDIDIEELKQMTINVAADQNDCFKTINKYTIGTDVIPRSFNRGEVYMLNAKVIYAIDLIINVIKYGIKHDDMTCNLTICICYNNNLPGYISCHLSIPRVEKNGELFFSYIDFADPEGPRLNQNNFKTKSFKVNDLYFDRFIDDMFELAINMFNECGRPGNISNKAIQMFIEFAKNYKNKIRIK